MQLDANAVEEEEVAEGKELAKGIADELLPAFIGAIKKSKEGEVSEREIVELKNNFEHAQDDLAALKKVVYEQHEPVIIWSRNFIDSYRKINTAVIISGLITLTGYFVQLYDIVQKGK
jgi:hypothetical protein